MPMREWIALTVIFTRIVSLVALVFAIASLLIASGWYKWPLKYFRGYETYILAFWVIVPPVWFWVDWVFLCDGLRPEKLDQIKHTHELARNIWLAMVSVLAYQFRIKVGEHH